MEPLICESSCVVELPWNDLLDLGHIKIVEARSPPLDSVLEQFVLDIVDLAALHCQGHGVTVATQWLCDSLWRRNKIDSPNLSVKQQLDFCKLLRCEASPISPDSSTPIETHHGLFGRVIHHLLCMLVGLWGSHIKAVVSFSTQAVMFGWWTKPRDLIRDVMWTELWALSVRDQQIPNTISLAHSMSCLGDERMVGWQSSIVGHQIEPPTFECDADNPNRNNLTKVTR